MGLFDAVRAWFSRGSDGGGGDPVDHEGFARLLLKRATDAGAPELLYDAEEFCLRGQNNRVHWLHNLFDEYLELDAQDRERALQMWVAMIVQADMAPPDDWASAASQVLPRVRSRAYLQATRLQLLTQGYPAKSLAYTPVCEHLVLTPVWDTPTAMASISDELVATWGVDAEEVAATAVRNLRDQQVPIAVATIEGGLKLIRVGDDYDSSRMLLPEFVASLELDGDPVLLPLARDRLLAAGSRDEAALQQMLDASGEMLQDRRLDAIRPAVFRQGRWETWSPAPGLACREAWMDRIRYGELVDYTTQKELLDAWHETNGIDVFVASYKLYGREEGGSFSIGILSPIPTLLPRTDKVLVMREDAPEPVEYDWDAFRARVGDAMRIEPDHWPVRYRIDGQSLEI